MTAIPPTLDLSCFAGDYPSARQRFLSILRQLPGGLLQHHTHSRHPLAGPNGEELYCDWALLSASPTPRRLLVLISGTHGVEGFAGSAIQADCLPLLIPLLEQHPELGVIAIHALNPWGFAWLRRCDHQGIDINRNFIDFGKGLPNNAHYAKLHAQVVRSRADASLESILQDIDTRELLRPEITQGQYQFPEGQFFGGHGPSWSRQFLETQTRGAVLAGAHRIAVIDLHTGLGPYGYGEIINDHPVSSVGFQWTQNWYGANALSSALGESVSAPKVGLLDYFWHHLMGARGSFVTLEFGTYSLTGLIESLLLEQLYHRRCRETGETRDISHPLVVRLLDFFYPRDLSWQHMVLLRARHTVQLALQGILA